MKGLFIFIAIIVILLVAGVVVYVGFNSSPVSPPNNLSNNIPNNSSNPPVACPALAKMCPDGSSIGMIAVNGKCVWQNCPNSNNSCVCPAGYVREGDICNPQCYYSTPSCLAPSLLCKNVSSG